MTQFTQAGLNARHQLLDACEGYAEELGEAVETQGLLNNIKIAREMLAIGNVRAAHTVARDVCGALERNGHNTDKLRQQMKDAHSVS